ncbi:hypothetical protein MVEG_06842 [Podila verticillata NRRL 6337]|nr:hypothetical protein MVEG_06842 [Podila verticillata NRRL 6337]
MVLSTYCVSVTRRTERSTTDNNQPYSPDPIPLPITGFLNQPTIRSCETGTGAHYSQGRPRNFFRANQSWYSAMAYN